MCMCKCVCILEANRNARNGQYDDSATGQLSVTFKIETLLEIKTLSSIN